jgi:hypothetical protein
MSEKLGFILTIVGFTVAAAGYVWLLSRTFQASEPWGTAIFFVPPLALVYLLVSFRRTWGPACVLLLGAGVVAIPYGIKYYQQQFVDLGERQKVVDGELHVTLTGWNKDDYSILERLPDTVVLQMANPDVTDNTLKYVNGMTRLRELDLNDSQVTDAGLGQLRRLANLQQLRLRKTKITDAGFRSTLAPMESLLKVEVTGTGVKGKTLREWKKAKPGRVYLN